jgi:Domain of Unknown Function (DUF1259)
METGFKNPSRRQMLIGGVGTAGLRAGAALIGGVAPGLAQTTARNGNFCSSLPVSEINSVLGAVGTIEPGEVLIFDFGRSDRQWTIFGTPVDPDWGFFTELAFQPLCQGAIVKWELCLLEEEVVGVVNALLDANLYPTVSSVNAVHNHFIQTTPLAKFVHGTAMGDPVKIAQILHDILSSQTKQPFEISPPGNTGLPNEDITNIIGGTSMIEGVVLEVDVERADRIRELGVELQPTAEIQSNFHFQKIGTNQAIVATEFTTISRETDAVCRTLRKYDFKITAVHNHELFTYPSLYYVHAGNTGDPLMLARAIREALGHTRSKFEH